MTDLRFCWGKMGVAPATAVPAPRESTGRFTPIALEKGVLRKRGGEGAFAGLITWEYKDFNDNKDIKYARKGQR